MELRLGMAAIFFLSVILFDYCSSCTFDDVAVYKVTLKTFHNEEIVLDDFQTTMKWSKVFGQSHNSTYNLYHIGEIAKPLVRDFVELGAVDQLLSSGGEDERVYDQFVAQAVTGSGQTETMVFADGEHSMVSLVSKLLTTPDWFIGVDSLELCVDTTWVEQITLDLELLDGGTMSGALNQEIPWPSNPIQEIEKVKVRHSDSMHSEVYHRKVKPVPPVAKVEFKKMKEYSTKQLKDLARKELFNKMNHKITEEMSEERDFLNDYEEIDDTLTTKNPLDKLKDLEEDPVGTPKPHQPDNNVIVVTKSPENSEELDNMDDVVMAVATGHKMGLGKHLPRHFKSRLHHAVNRNHDKDCVVSEWSLWSKCPELCSPSAFITRTRKVIRQRKVGGRPCPQLVEKKTCGHHCRGDDYGW